jgi:hypothetical protein
VRGAHRDDDIELLAGEHVAELSRLLLQPRDRLGVGDLQLAIGDLLCEGRVLGRERADLGIEVTALRHLSVDRERHQSTDPSDQHDCNPAQRDRALDGWTWGGTDGAILSPAMCVTNGTM